MFGNLEIMRMAHGLAKHASARQELVARNVANADTPGYRAQDLGNFADLYRNGDVGEMRATRAGHIGAAAAAGVPSRSMDVGGETSPNGNNVSLEAEMMRSAEIRHQHDRAMSIYKASLDVLRTSIGRPR